MRHIAASGGTVIPAILALETLGFTVARPAGSDWFQATRDDESYLADDPVALLGLVRLVEVRGWNWMASDKEVDAALERFVP